MPAICWGCTTALYAAHRHRAASPCHAEPNGPFVFISVQRTNLPFSRRYRDHLSLFFPPSALVGYSYIRGLFALYSRVSPLSRKPASTLFSFLHFPQTRVTSIFLHSRVDGFGRVKEPPLPRSLFCFALRAVKLFAIVTATSSMEGFVLKVPDRIIVLVFWILKSLLIGIIF